MSKLYVVPTPIGNLEDITFRAIRVLKESDVVLAEDTRTTKKLFNYYNIKTPLFSFHSYNEHKVLNKWINKIKLGHVISIVSEAGTPAISDPGFLLIRECIKEDLLVDCLPGGTALIPAIVNSGFPCEKFVFEGFIPVKKGRKNKLQFLSEEKRTIIFYESPHRIIKTLNQFIEYFGEKRLVSVSREISKIFEETIRGSLIEVSQYFKNNQPKGEFVIVLQGKK